MGAYVNPENMSKEDWLNKNAAEFLAPIAWNLIIKGYLPIVLLQNPGFSAAAIAFSPEEYSVFTNPDDLRPKRYFYAIIEKLHSVSPELAGYIESYKNGKKGRRA